MRRVLVFGGSGFLGRHLCRELTEHAAVLCPSRRQCDLVTATPADLCDLLAATRPDAVVNCAGAMAGNTTSLVQANTVVTARLIDAVAAAAPTARLVRFGSAAEYGLTPQGRIAAETDPAVPVSDYGVSQLAATRLVQLAVESGRVDAVVLRVFNPIGPGMPNGTLLGRVRTLLARARRDGAAEISTGPLGAFRDFVDVRDVVSAALAALTTAPLPERVYNVASGHAVPVRQAVRLLAEVAGFTGEIREDARPPGRSANVTWVCGNPDRAAHQLGWRPVHHLAESVKALWQAQ